VAELTALPSGYPALLEELKARIRAAQLRAALTLNQETIVLYWSIGQDLSSRFATEGWGTKVVDRLAKDLGTEFPGVEGFSLRSLRYMRSFAEAWPDPQILQLAAKIDLGTSHGPARSAQRWPEPGMVPPCLHRTWLEPQRSHSSHLNQVEGSGREGPHQFFSDPAGREF
jgi:hypothetical protein